MTNGAISSSSRAFEFTVRHKSSRYGFPHSEISFSSQEKDIHREIVGDYIQLAAPYPKMKTQYDEEKGYYDIVYKPETEKPTEKYENGVKVWTNPDGTPVQQEYHLSTTHKSIEDALADITKKTEAFKAIFEQKLELLRRVDIKQEKQKKKTMPKDEFLVKYLYKGGLF